MYIHGLTDRYFLRGSERGRTRESETDRQEDRDFLRLGELVPLLGATGVAALITALIEP